MASSSLQVQRDNFTILGLNEPGRLHGRTIGLATLLILALGTSLSLICRLSPPVRTLFSKNVPLWSLPLTFAVTALIMNRLIAKRNDGVTLFADDPILTEFRKLFAIEAKLQMNLDNGVPIQAANGERSTLEQQLQSLGRLGLSEEEYKLREKEIFLRESQRFALSGKEYDLGAERSLQLEVGYVRLISKLGQHKGLIAQNMNQHGEVINAKEGLRLASQQAIYQCLIKELNMSEEKWCDIYVQFRESLTGELSTSVTRELYTLFRGMQFEQNPVKREVYQQCFPQLFPNFPPSKQSQPPRFQKQYNIKKMAALVSAIALLGSLLIFSTRVQTFFAKKVSFYSIPLVVASTAYMAVLLFMQRVPLLFINHKELEKIQLGQELGKLQEQLPDEPSLKENQKVDRCLAKLILCEMQRRMKLADFSQQNGENSLNVNLNGHAGLQPLSYFLLNDGFRWEQMNSIGSLISDLKNTYYRKKSNIEVSEQEERLLTKEISACFDKIDAAKEKYRAFF